MWLTNCHPSVLNRFIQLVLYTNEYSCLLTTFQWHLVTSCWLQLSGARELEITWFHVWLVSWKLPGSTCGSWAGNYLVPRVARELEITWFHVWLVSWKLPGSTCGSWAGNYLVPRVARELEITWCHVWLVSWKSPGSTCGSWAGNYLVPRVAELVASCIPIRAYRVFLIQSASSPEP